jgi:predicted nucleic acid-binding protein
MTNLGLRGGSIYDALIAKSAQKAGADQILTFNYRDFMRVWPDGINYLIEP